MAPSRGQLRRLLTGLAGAALLAPAWACGPGASAGLESGRDVVAPGVAASPGVAGLGRIVFERRARSGPASIFTAAPDGSDLRRLSWRGNSTSPRWSPGGDRIAFTRDRAIWVMRADGSHKRRVLARAHTPSWSPDGRRLLVNGTGPRPWRPRFGIFNLRTETTRWFPLGDSEGGVHGTDWSWRNNRIVFGGSVNADASADTFTVNPDFTGLKQVTRTPRRNEIMQRWAPTGPPRLAYMVQDWTTSEGPCQDRVEILDLTTDRRTRVRCAAEEPAWSPDATELLLDRHIYQTFDHDLIRVDLESDRETVVVPHTSRYYQATAPDWRRPR